jgi:hypothetical protein
MEINLMTLKLSAALAINAAQIAETGVITNSLTEPASGTSQDGGVVDGILDSAIYSIIASNTTNTFDGGTI